MYVSLQLSSAKITVPFFILVSSLHALTHTSTHCKSNFFEKMIIPDKTKKQNGNIISNVFSFLHSALVAQGSHGNDNRKTKSFGNQMKCVIYHLENIIAFHQIPFAPALTYLPAFVPTHPWPSNQSNHLATYLLSGVASPTILSRYANFNSLSLFISL